MIRFGSIRCHIIAISAWSLLILGAGPSEAKSSFMRDVRQTIAAVRTSGSVTTRTKAAEHLASMTEGNNGNKIDGNTIADVISLLDAKDDSVRYWVAITLGNIGPRANGAVPQLEKILGAIDCLQADKTSAQGIRYALTRMGVTPPPLCRQ
jgi:hypothetical protein